MEEADKLGIELVRMPPYQPQLNPVEEVWRFRITTGRPNNNTPP